MVARFLVSILRGGAGTSTISSNGGQVMAEGKRDGTLYSLTAASLLPGAVRLICRFYLRLAEHSHRGIAHESLDTARYTLRP